MKSLWAGLALAGLALGSSAESSCACAKLFKPRLDNPTIGLSKSAAQKGVRHLVRRRLLKVHKDSVTATPEYRVLHPWRR